MNSTTVTLRLRLARPPVIRVRTTIYFAEVENLTLSELAPFVVEMSQSYPSISEQFPLPPIGDDGSVVGFASRSSGLPMPLVSMVADSENEISFQADRLSLSWNFDPLKPDKIYPGFELLREELWQAFSTFEEQLQSLGHQLAIQASQVLYRNSVNELPGAGVALYLLTGLENITARHITDDRTYAGARLRFPANEGGIRRSVAAGVDSSSDETTVLWIKVLSRPAGSESAFVLLDDAHDESIRRFIQFTPGWLRETWGVVGGPS